MFKLEGSAMAKRIILISSLPVLNKAFSFFVALLFIIITGCSLPNPVQPTAEEEYKAQKITGCSLPNPAQPTAEEEYKAQKKLLQLQSYVDDEDYMSARFILSGFQKDFSNTNFYKVYSKRIDELVKKIEKNTRDIKVEDRIEYFFVPPRPETKLWKEYLSRAERIVSQNQGRMGIAVLRVIFEDESIEGPSVRADCGELYILHRDGGYVNTSSFKSGDAVFVGSEFRRYSASDSNDKDVSVIGNIIIGGIYHYPTKLKIEVQKGKAVAFGEIIVRAIPKEYCGNLKVKVETEEGLKLMDAGVILKVSGFYSGKNEPVKEGSCLFNSIGPGSYSVELAPNDTFGSPGQSAEVVSGQTTEATINAYRHRMIELDWRFHGSKEPNNWLSGRKIIKTKEYWQPGEEWGDVHYPVVQIGDWIDNTCMIRRANGDLMPINTDVPFEEMDFPLNFSSSFRDYPIKEGDIFAWRGRRGGQKEDFWEALIHVGKITPIGIVDVPKSSVSKEEIPVKEAVAVDKTN
jgi:predicted RecA/RadA family phage recombinase